MTDGSLARCVSEVRLALGDGDQRMIKTVPRRGYRFVSAVSHPITAAASTEGPRSFSSDAAQRLSIVVVPFTNLSSDPEQDYFVEGVSQSLITDLSRGMPGSFVIAHSTAFTYKGKAVDATQIGRDLGVRYPLEGSILRSGERVRVNAQLIDAQTGAHLWAERFDKDRTDLFTMQDEIVARIARTVGLQVIDEEARRATRKGRAGHPNATDLTMRGWALHNRARTRETTIAALGLFQDALRIDDHNVDALVGIASVHANAVAFRFHEHGDKERLRLADEALARVLSLDPNNAHALGRRCGLRRVQQRFEDAIRACETAIAAPYTRADSPGFSSGTPSNPLPGPSKPPGLGRAIHTGGHRSLASVSLISSWDMTRKRSIGFAKQLKRTLISGGVILFARRLTPCLGRRHRRKRHCASACDSTRA